jgi:hypothetical protein
VTDMCDQPVCASLPGCQCSVWSSPGGLMEWAVLSSSCRRNSSFPRTRCIRFAPTSSDGIQTGLVNLKHEEALAWDGELARFD